MAIKMINEILSAIQSESKAPKNQFNKFGGYSYRNCEDILEALKPLLSAHKAVNILSDEIVMIGNRYYVKATATLRVGDEEISVSAFAREDETKKGMDVSQLTGSTSSYARKYALNGLYAIDDTKDADYPNNSGEKDNRPSEKSQINNFRAQSAPPNGASPTEQDALRASIKNQVKIIQEFSGMQSTYIEKTAMQETGCNGKTVEELRTLNQYLTSWVRTIEQGAG